MRFRVGGNGDVEVRYALETGNQISRIREPIRMRHIRRLAFHRVAAQRDDVSNALVPIATRDIEHFAARRPYASQMRRTGERRLTLDARNEAMRALARRPVRAIRHRNKTGRERREPLNRLPQRGIHLHVARRKELE